MSDKTRRFRFTGSGLYFASAEDGWDVAPDGTVYWVNKHGRSLEESDLTLDELIEYAEDPNDPLNEVLD